MTARHDRRMPIGRWLAILCGAALLVSSSALAVHSHLTLDTDAAASLTHSHAGEGEAETDHVVAPCSLCGAAARDVVADAVGPVVETPREGRVSKVAEPLVRLVLGHDAVAAPRGPPSL